MSDIKSDSDSYLGLSSEPLRFEPVSKVTNVFYDEANKEVLSVRGGGTLGVVVKDEERTLTFCMDHKGVISSIKFSPDHLLLAIQRTNKSVELFSFDGGGLGSLLVQECRSKDANLLGFIWTGTEHLLLVTDHTIEFFQVLKEKVTTRFIKSYNQSTVWFVWSPECEMLLLCTQIAPASATIQPFTFTVGQISKLQKFEVETSGSSTTQQGSGVVLGERDIYVGILYGNTSVCILRHPAVAACPAYLDVYTQNKDGSFTKSQVCVLEVTGKFAVNIIDSLIVVHHQSSKSSLVFDILSANKVCSGASSVYPITLPKTMQPFFLEETGAVPMSSSVPRSVPCQLYAPTWVVFQPDVIIDARLGCMWRLCLYLDALVPLVDNKVQLVDILLRRRDAKAKQLILEVVKELIEMSKLDPLSFIFDKINTIYRQHLNSVMQSQMGECVSGGSGTAQTELVVGSVIVDQVDMFSHVFASLIEQAESNLENGRFDAKHTVSYRLMVGVTLDYIRSLCSAGISVQHFVNELVINGLVKTRQFFQLHQLLQYRVLSDSKPLACILLSLVGVYGAAEQLSLDMLSRLNTAHDEIIEVLLSKKLVIQALRYAKSICQLENVSARKFLEVAMSTDDPMVFYSTFKFFALRNSATRGSSSFLTGEHCDIYTDHYQKLFGNVPQFV